MKAMKLRRSIIPLLRIWAVAAVALLMTSAPADLDSYLKKPEPKYKWELTATKEVQGGKIYDMRLTSQTWQGGDWNHRVQVFYPNDVKHPEWATVLNTGGGGDAMMDALGMGIATQGGAPFVILWHIPNQPLYGLTEDALIVYTWGKFMETGDETWPLHFPMAKAVLKCMDAVQAMAVKEKLTKPTNFVVTGASKRGWTTWLVGAAKDPRVKGIVPMVIDILNVPAQIPHQLEAFGQPSEEVADYTGAGMVEKLKTPQGRRLLELEDPYSYRDRLTMPKLIINGTNDRYWTLDALNLYWGDLKGEKHVLYVPNSGHGLEDKGRVIATSTAFVRTLASGKTLPKMSWDYKATPDGGLELSINSDPAPKSAVIFTASSKSKDFRDSKWSSQPMAASGKGFAGRIVRPNEGFVAMYGEATYEIDGKSYTLSTQIRILGAGK